MRFFRRIGLDWLSGELGNLTAEITRNESLWLVNQNRQQTVRVQQHTQSIFLRSALICNESNASLNNIPGSRETKIASQFPVTMAVLHRISLDLSSELCRALYARLKPHSMVYRHIDSGDYYRGRNRYHLVLISPSGSPMRAGSELITMAEGELWWFNNKLPHESMNESDGWRTHLIFDLLPVSR
jgi:hypothetical protein